MRQSCRASTLDSRGRGSRCRAPTIRVRAADEGVVLLARALVPADCRRRGRSADPRGIGREIAGRPSEQRSRPHHRGRRGSAAGVERVHLLHARAAHSPQSRSTTCRASSRRPHGRLGDQPVSATALRCPLGELGIRSAAWTGLRSSSIDRVRVIASAAAISPTAANSCSTCGARQIAGDEDEPRAAVVVGPVFELDRPVRDVLHRVDDDRARQPSTATMPLTRSRSAPRSAVSTAIACSKAGQGSGSVEKQRKAVDAVAVRMRVVVLGMRARPGRAARRAERPGRSRR